MRQRPEVHIRFAFGDLQSFGMAVIIAIQGRDFDVIRRQMWVIRETRRRGEWRPWTFGDYIVLRRMRRYMAHWPRRTVHPAKWRHKNVSTSGSSPTSR